MGAYIKAISYYLPDNVLSNEELARLFPQYTPDEIFRRTGIRERRIAAADELPSDSAVIAAEKFFKEHKFCKKQDIDFLIFCTEMVDRRAPATACILQNRIGLPLTTGAIDLPMGCSGFIYGLLLAQSLINNKVCKNVLFFTGDAATKALHPADHELRMIFGDAMAVTLISDSVNNCIGSFVLGTDGSGASNLIAEGCCAAEKPSIEWLEKYADVGGLPYGKISMNGPEILNFSLKRVPPMVKELLEKEKLALDDIDLFIFHQASGFILEVLRRKMKIPKEKFFTNMEFIGNTVAATIPLALYDALKDGLIKKGSKVMIAGFGIGYSWGATVLTF
ncbi:MAG: 3-oxoacyl-ACP synthase III family protein [Bacteroidia bacterium]